MVAALKKVSPAPTLGTLIDKTWDLREKKRSLEAQVKEIEAEIADSETAVMEQMDAQGVEKATGKKATISISKTVVANIVDFEALCKYVKKTGFFHLFQRRISDPAARELFETKGAVPGLEPFTKRKLTLRTV